MAGPTLQLGVNAAGQDTLAGLNAEIAKLRTNLQSLKGAKADLSGLVGANQELQELRTAFAATSAQLRPTFTELAGTIRSGFSEVSKATVAGSAEAAGAARDGLSQLQTEFDRSVAGRQRYTQAEIDAIRTGGLRIAETERAAAAARAAAIDSAPTRSVRPEVIGPVVAAPQSSALTEELARMRTGLTDGIQGLRTGFAELAEAIRGGLTSSASAASTGGARVRSIVAQERQQLQAEYEKAIADRRLFTQDELQVIKDAGVRLIEADRQMLAARAAANVTNRVALGGGEVINPPKVAATLSVAPATEIDAAYAQRARQDAQEAASIRASEWARAQFDADLKIAQVQKQGFQGFAAIERDLAAQRIAVAKESAAALASGIAAADASAFNANGLRSASVTRARQATEADAAYKAAATASFTQMAAQVAAAKEAAWTEAEAQANAGVARAQLQSLQGFTAIEREAAAAKLAAIQASEAALARGLAENNAFVLAVEAKAAKDAAAIQAAAETVARAEAAYQARTASAQASQQRGARAQLDQGLPVQAVQANFGPTATSAAQAATSLDELTAAHQRAGLAGTQHVATSKALNAALSDLHSAARGVASGFDAMFLTWGNIVPLLAGAAFAHAFVETVKQGSSVYQTLEIIKQLSDETDTSISLLRNTLLDLAANGPQGPQEIANAMKALSLAGLNAAEVASSVRAALTLSIVGEMPAQKAAESLVAVSTAYGYAAGDFNRVNDVIAKTAAVSMSSVEGMTQSFRVASTVAQQYGVKLEDTATQLGLLANLGIRNQQAGTAVTQFYTGLAANTKKGHDALTLIVGDVKNLRDEFGNMKPAVDILDMLNKGLSKLSGQAQASALSAIYNNRGARDAISNVIASRTPSYDDAGKVAVDSSGKVITAWDKMAKQVTESYGFAAIAMANLSLTAENQMKSVLSALQGAFVATFESLEPTILVVSDQLRRAFNSQDFKSTLGGLAGSVANLIVTLVEHANALKIAAEAWLIYKAAAIGSALFTSLAAGISALGAAFTAVTSGAGLAAGGMVALRAAMGPIGFVLTALAGAWALYKATSTNASTTAADVASLKSGQIIEALNKESERLEARNKLLLDGVSAREADIQLAGIQAQQDLAKDRGKVQTESQQKLAAAEQNLADLRTENEKLTSGKGGGYASPGTRQQFAEALVAAEDQVTAAKEQQRILNRDLTNQQQQVTDAVNRQVAAAKVAATISPPKVTPLGANSGTGEFVIPKDRSVAAANDTLAGLRAVYTAQEAALKLHYDTVTKIEAIRHTSGQTSDIQFEVESQEREQIYFSQRLGNLNTFIDASAASLAVLKAAKDKNKDQRAIGEEEKEQVRLRSLRDELVLQQQLSEEQRKATAYKQEQDISKFISQQMTELVTAEQLNVVKQNLSTLTSDQRAVEEARLTTIAKFNDKIREQQQLLATAQTYATSLTNNRSESGGDDTKIARANAEVERLQGNVTRLQESAVAGGQVAAQTMAKTLVPQWQTMLNDWKNVTQLMYNAYDEMVTGILQKGQDIFTRLLKTGKLTAGELIDVIRDAISKKIYQETIGPGLAQVAQGVAGAFGLSHPAATAGAPSPVDLAAQNTTVALTSLNDFGINPMAGALLRLITAADSAATALLNIGGGGGGGLAGLFGGGSTGGYNFAGTGSGAAPGFTGDINFAKGSAFTNRVYSQPTNFHFANGDGFSKGQMAEAGPEAVMPLKRGPDGSLGVALHNQQQQNGSGGNVAVVIENHGPSQPRVQQSTRSDGTREIRMIIDQAKAEMVDDIHSGGPLSGAIETQYGSNRASGLPRR